MVFIACFVVFGGAMATIFGQPTANRIGVLPDDLRTTLYQRTLSEVGSVCTKRVALESGDLHEHCLGQASFLARFPECGSSCRATISAILPRSHR
jgi:hypothetical protein